MLLAQAAAKPTLAALFESAGLVARLGHFARFPKPEVLPTIAFRDYLAAAFVSFAGSLVCHQCFALFPCANSALSSRLSNSSTIPLAGAAS